MVRRENKTFNMIISGLLTGEISPLEVIIILIALIFSFTAHELGHSAMAYFYGDTTQKTNGRLNLNPINHIDPIGFVMILLVGFGWAKPVVYSLDKIKHPRVATIFIALAGPLMNIVIAILTLLILKLFISFHIYNGIIQTVIFTIVGLNLGLAIFNLIPLPPLDGSHLIMAIIPRHAIATLRSFYTYGSFILLGLIILDYMLPNYNIFPIGEMVQSSIKYLFRILRIT